MPDGQHFIMIEADSPIRRKPTASHQNWFEELNA
jgi:hypothetical protein